MEENKIEIHLYGDDRLDYYDYDSRTNTEGDNGLIDRLQRLLGKDFKISIKGIPVRETEEDIYLVIEKVEAVQ